MSLFPNATDTRPSGTVSVAEMVDMIRGDDVLCQQVLSIRELVASGADAGSIAREKRGLRGVTLSGEFSRRSGDSLVRHSGLLQVDIDDIRPEQVDSLSRRLRGDPRVAVMFRSPRERLKCVVAVPEGGDSHAGMFEVVRRYFSRIYGVEIDIHVRDVGRLCFLSHDPEAYVAEGRVLRFEDDREPVRDHLPPVPDDPVRHRGCIGASGSRADEGERISFRAVRSALGALARAGRPDYERWLRIIAATRAALGNDGQAMALLTEFFPEERQGEYREKFREGLNRIPARHLLEEASNAGWRPIDVSRVDLARLLAMGPEARASERPQVIIDGFLRRGGMMLVAGKTKERKSFMALDMAISVAHGRNLFGRFELEGFAVTRGRVRYYDLENPPDEVGARVCAALEALGDPDESREVAGNISLSALRGLDLGIREIMDDIRGNVGSGDVVIIDPLYPLISGDVKEMADVSNLLRPLGAMAEQTGCGVIVIDHFRKGGEGSPGDQILGSVAKSMVPDAVVTMKMEGSGLFTVNAELRCFPSLERLVLEYDDNAKRFLRVRCQDNQSIHDIRRCRDNLGRMRQAWEGGPEAVLTRQECERAWGVGGSRARVILAELARQGMVERLSRGRDVTYRLLPAGLQWMPEEAGFFGDIP